MGKFRSFVRNKENSAKMLEKKAWYQEWAVMGKDKIS